MVAIASPRGIGSPERESRIRGWDLALLQLELGVLEDAGIAQLPELAQPSQLGVGPAGRVAGRPRRTGWPRRWGRFLARGARRLLSVPTVVMGNGLRPRSAGGGPGEGLGTPECG